MPKEALRLPCRAEPSHQPELAEAERGGAGLAGRRGAPHLAVYPPRGVAWSACPTSPAGPARSHHQPPPLVHQSVQASLSVSVSVSLEPELEPSRIGPSRSEPERTNEHRPSGPGPSRKP